MNHVQEALRVLRESRESNFVPTERTRQKVRRINASGYAERLSTHVDSDHMKNATVAELRKYHIHAKDAHEEAQKQYPESNLNHHIHKLTAIHHAKMAATLSKHG